MSPQREPPGVGGILTAAFDLYGKQYGPLWTTVAVIVIPIQVLVFILVRVSLQNPSANNGTVYTTGSTAVPALAVGLLGFISVIITWGALSRLLVETYTGHATDWRESIAYASRRFWSLALLSIVSAILLAIGFVLLIIPGIFLTVAWCVAVPVLVFESPGILGSLQRSWELVKGNWWVTFGALLVTIVLIIGLSFLIGAIFGGIGSNSVNGVLILSGVSRIIADLIAYPLSAAVITVIYVNWRTQKEGVPAEQLLAGAGPYGPAYSPPAPETPAPEAGSTPPPPPEPGAPI